MNTVHPDDHSYVVKWMTRDHKELMTDLVNTYTIKEALNWFGADNTQVIDG
jgi:hypothetical protein